MIVLHWQYDSMAYWHVQRLRKKTMMVMGDDYMLMIIIIFGVVFPHNFPS